MFHKKTADRGEQFSVGWEIYMFVYKINSNALGLEIPLCYNWRPCFNSLSPLLTRFQWLENILTQIFDWPHNLGNQIVIGQENKVTNLPTKWRTWGKNRDCLINIQFLDIHWSIIIHCKFYISSKNSLKYKMRNASLQSRFIDLFHHSCS